MKIGQNLLTKMQHVQFTDRLKVLNKTARDKKKKKKSNGTKEKIFRESRADKQFMNFFFF